jgi:hypothetical protein
MSYVWSRGLTISVGSLPTISQVTISADKTKVNVGEAVHIYVNFTLDRAASNDVLVEVVLAEGTKSNIIKRDQTYVLAGDTRGSIGFTVIFNNAGTYTIYGGARVVGWA